MASQQRIGFGYDVHRLVEGRRLVLGGVDIPYPMGLEGHSDADVLLHAVADALLGAAALGDIGKHFPNTDPRYQGISSLILLRHVAELLTQRRCTVVNVDATVVLEAPKIAPYVDLMRQNIADSLAISIEQISVKATTHEGLGFVGTHQGASAHAVALLTMHERIPGKPA
ncbi:MAG TPA: 2-C-methyl-D-erythritol 2,4-cyclodiphosphate synthase [Bacteroidota bacterium]|nr:2-C-methyl-D-erythritol 2,4-cyclodiphosphate synthase [Bacteroidota bacterium]